MTFQTPALSLHCYPFSNDFSIIKTQIVYTVKITTNTDQKVLNIAPKS